jgi:hypothetical protein
MGGWVRGFVKNLGRTPCKAGEPSHVSLTAPTARKSTPRAVRHSRPAVDWAAGHSRHRAVCCAYVFLVRLVDSREMNCACAGFGTVIAAASRPRPGLQRDTVDGAAAERHLIREKLLVTTTSPTLQFSFASSRLARS